MSEKRLAAQDGAKLQKNSGRGKYQKGDAILHPFCIDYKEYTSSFSISKKNWKKHASDSWETGQYEPLIAVVLDGDTRVAVLDWEMFKDMHEAWLDRESGRLNADHDYVTLPYDEYDDLMRRINES